MKEYLQKEVNTKPSIWNDSFDIVPILNKYAADRWSLVTVVPNWLGSLYSVLLIFERDVVSPETPL